MTTTANLTLTESHLPVLCCCTPSNLMGYLPVGNKELPVKPWEDENGETGLAYSSEETPQEQLESMPGFVPAEESQVRSAKTWRKTWRTWKK